MRNITLIVLLLSSFMINAQTEFSKLSKKDSTEVAKTFEGFIKAIEKSEKATVLDYCLENIDCIGCKESFEFNEEGYFVTKMEFYENNLSTFLNSQVYKAIKKKGFHISCTTIRNHKPKSLPKEYGNDLILYEVWIQTYSPNEWAKDHEGQSNAFQFVKIDNKLKLFGLTSIP